MRVTILQTDIIWCQPKANIDGAYCLMADAPDSDIYVLPEMWATGFITDEALLTQQAEHAENILEWMKATAVKRQCAVCGSLAVKDDDGKYRNRLYFVHPDGSFDFYDKRHLFAYGGENTCYEAGKDCKIVNFGGLRIMLATCYDLRFPVWLRNKNERYDAILLVANWPESRQDVWDVLVKARALENQCYVIAANRVGVDPVCTYSGHSQIIDSKGNVVASDNTGNKQIITAELDIYTQNRFRRKFPVLEDLDDFEIIKNKTIY